MGDYTLISNLPLDMLQYKFLLNPTRLAIMKLVHRYGRLSSIEIKTNLKISWSEYQTNIRALEAKLYVTIKDDFEEELKRQFVYLEPLGMEDYVNLVQLLEEFITEEPISENFEDNLYPNEKK